MRLFKLNNKQISDFLENLDLIMLGIKSENRKKLAQAKVENNIFLYNDILFRAMLHDDKRAWWHTGIWGSSEEES